eukprot:13353667-Ditylum_brightwellii.AAC.1
MQLEQINHDLDTALKNAENELITYPQTPWTKEIDVAHMVIKYWQTALSLHRHQLEQSDILKNLCDHLPADIDVYQGDITRTLLAQICKAVKWKQKA